MSEPNTLFTETILLLGGAVVSAPIFKRLGLGTVLGYLAAGVVIGPIFHGLTMASKSWTLPNSASSSCCSSSDWS